jgi:hypothetical protein
VTRRINRRKREAEAKSPHKVDIPIPLVGLGNRLNVMLQWCRVIVGSGDWAEHTHSEWPIGKSRADCVRFCFTNAQAFRRQWCSGEA